MNDQPLCKDSMIFFSDERSRRGDGVIQANMCLAFLVKWYELRESLQGALPSRLDILHMATPYAGIFPNLSILDITADNECHLVRSPRVLSEWLKLPTTPSLKDIMPEAHIPSFIENLVHASVPPCGLRERSTRVSADGMKTLSIESIYLPIRANVGSRLSIVGFSSFHETLTSEPAQTATLPERKWFDLGQGMPATSPEYSA